MKVITNDRRKNSEVENAETLRAKLAELNALLQASPKNVEVSLAQEEIEDDEFGKCLHLIATVKRIEIL